MELTHLDERGRAKMVDVAQKEVTLREATAEALLAMRPETLKRIYEGTLEKGDVLSVARIAGIMGAKKTSELIPLCHPLEISSVIVEFEPAFEAGLLRIRTKVRLWGRTGAEMEALVAGAITALAVYDMIKAVDRQAALKGLWLLEKSGGKSGLWRREAPEGRVLAVNRADRRGIPKENVGEGFLEVGVGLVGDAHAGSERELSLFPIEALALAPKEILSSLREGEYSENITIQGIPLEELRVGKKLKIGEAEVEIVQIGKGKLEPEGRPWIVSREGRFARVTRSGKVKVGDSVLVL